MNRASGVRLTSSTSSVCEPPRSRITVAAWRGGVALPRLSRWPGPEWTIDGRAPWLGLILLARRGSTSLTPRTLLPGNLTRMSAPRPCNAGSASPAATSTIPRRATRTGASPRGPPSRTSPTRGSAPCAEPVSATSSSTRTDPMSDWDALLAFDREHVWHPYGALPGALRAAAGRLGARGAPEARRRARADRRHVLVVVCDPRLPPSRARRRRPRAARADGARDVRRAHARAGGAAGGAPGGARARRAGAGVLRRLRLGLGRGRDQAVPAVPARGGPSRAHAAADRAGRLPRRHVRRDGRLRSRSAGCTACSPACSPSTCSPSARPTASTRASTRPGRRM